MAARDWGAKEEEGYELVTSGQDGILRWEAGTFRVYEQHEALQLDLYSSPMLPKASLLWMITSCSLGLHL